MNNNFESITRGINAKYHYKLCCYLYKYRSTKQIPVLVESGMAYEDDNKFYGVAENQRYWLSLILWSCMDGDGDLHC